MVTRIVDDDQPFGGTWTFELTPAADGTLVTITGRGEIYNIVFRFLAAYVFGTRRRWRASWRRSAFAWLGGGQMMIVVSGRGPTVVWRD